MKNNKIQTYWIDLFCGAGGTSTGIHFSGENVKVLACVNHDANAIKSHQLNHPDTVHFTEDIRDFRVIEKLKKLAEALRKSEPNCIINLWASLECTNHSRAKGGLSRDGDSRSLANYMNLYLEAIKPNYFYVENVREFLDWGPIKIKSESLNESFTSLFVDKAGKYINVPIPHLKRTYFNPWIESIKAMGYNYEYRILNAANFGAYQKRERLFLQFSKTEFPISWPYETHSKKVSLTSNVLHKWKAVKDVLNLEDQGESIFNRKKPLVENTLKRIYAGLEKFVPKGEFQFSKTYNSGSDKNRVNTLNSVIGTVTTTNTHSVVSLNTYYGNSGLHSIDSPSPTITTKDRVAKVDVCFIDQQYTKSLPISIDQPCNALTTVPKFCLITPKSFLYNPQYSSKGNSIEEPCFTLIARMDKAPPSIITVTPGLVEIYIDENDSVTMIKIKHFMAKYRIIDIKMRMLNIPELKQIQGFPLDYKLYGTQTEQKKYIGNAVEVNMAKALITNNLKTISQIQIAA